MEIEFTTVCRITDPATGRILAQERVKSWQGVAFPGGHVEENESAVEAVKREVREETGLEIENIAYTGLVHWIEPDGKRTLIFAFVADWAGGALTETCDEGRNFWVAPAQFEKHTLSPHLRDQLPLFERGAFRECFYGLDGDARLAPVITP